MNILLDPKQKSTLFTRRTRTIIDDEDEGEEYSTSCGSVANDSNSDSEDDDDDDENNISSKSLIEGNSCDGDVDKWEMRNGRKKSLWKMCMIMFVCFVVTNCVFVIINVVLYKFFKQYKIGLLNDDGEEKSTSKKYQMVYHKLNNNQFSDIVVDEIFEIDLEFDGDFYHFEDEKGNGVIVKLDSEGDLNKICVDQCNCHVECQYNDDCNNGFVCKDYLCVDDESNSLQNRRKKETVGSHTERKVAPVVVAVPMLMCIFGVFSLMSLAIEYGEKYLIVSSFCRIMGGS